MEGILLTVWCYIYQYLDKMVTCAKILTGTNYAKLILKNHFTVLCISFKLVPVKNDFVSSFFRCDQNNMNIPVKFCVAFEHASDVSYTQ